MASLGSHIRMKALKPTELPAHPDLAHLQSGGAPHQLQEFVHTLLEEGDAFMTGYLPKNFQVKSTNKHSPPSTAHVELLHHEISAHDLPEEGRTMGQSETWFARTSVHQNARETGTASWEEFNEGLRANHSQHEKDYTPSVVDARKVLDWDKELESLGRTANEWSEITADLMEMVHNLPSPLQTRVFPVMVITAKRDQQFLVVQIPVDMTKMEQAKYVKDSKYTVGMYCSVERGELVENGGKVKWQMATASDAKGVLPMWAQKLGVPDAVVKDVGLFIGWCAEKRKSRT